MILDIQEASALSCFFLKSVQWEGERGDGGGPVFVTMGGTVDHCTEWNEPDIERQMFIGGTWELEDVSLVGFEI